MNFRNRQARAGTNSGSIIRATTHGAGTLRAGTVIRKRDKDEEVKHAMVEKPFQYHVNRVTFTSFMRLLVNTVTGHYQVLWPEWQENPVKACQKSMCKIAVLSSANYFYSKKINKNKKFLKVLLTELVTSLLVHKNYK